MRKKRRGRLLSAGKKLTGGFRFNDGAIDCMGRFWAGAMFEYRSLCVFLIVALDFHIMATNLKVFRCLFFAQIGVLLCYEPDGSVRRMIEGLIIPNGIYAFLKVY